MLTFHFGWQYKSVIVDFSVTRHQNSIMVKRNERKNGTFQQYTEQPETFFTPIFILSEPTKGISSSLGHLSCLFLSYVVHEN